jgi:hypothetical protein
MAQYCISRHFAPFRAISRHFAPFRAISRQLAPTHANDVVILLAQSRED